MKSELTRDEIQQLLDDASDEFPDSDFIASVRDFFEDRGFITEAQEDALNKIADGD